MTEKEKAIEEMAKCYCDYCMKQTGERECKNQNDKSCRVFWDCEFYYNAGYRKIPEGAVVILPEDKKIQFVTLSFYEEQVKNARKETAREVLDKVDYESNGQTKQITDLLRRKYGVEEGE